MSLFGARKTSTFQRAKERLDKKMAEESTGESQTSSSGIGAVLDRHLDMITGPVSAGGTATTSEIAHELSELDRKDQQRAFHGTQEYERLKAQEEKEDYDAALNRARIEDDLRRRKDSQATPRQESGWLPSNLDDMRAYSDLTGKTGVTGVTRHRSRSVGSTGLELSSPPPTTSYGGSILAMPPGAIPQDPFSTPRESAGIIARRYIEAEENASQQGEKEGGIEETRKVYTPIPRKFVCSDSSDEGMTEVEWREEEPYMTPTKKGKKRNKRKGVVRPVTPERRIPNIPQTPSRRKLEADWAKPAETAANEGGVGNLEAFIGEYLWNTNGLRDFMATNQLHDEQYDEWCLKQAEYMAARQNHTDAAVTSNRKICMEIKKEVELTREYDEERAEKLDDRLSKIEKKLAKIAPVNLAKMIENALSGCMEKMVDQLTDRVVSKLEKLAEKEKTREEVRRGKQVENTLEDAMSDVEFEPGVTFSREENEKVERAIQEEMEVEKQELEQSKHAPVIPPGGVSGEFPRLKAGEVTILKRKPVVPAVPQQKKKEAKKLEVKVILTGPKAGGKKPDVRKPEVKKPEKKPEEKKKGTWAQTVVAPPKKNPGQAQQQQRQGENKKRGDSFQEVKRAQKKEEMRPVPPGQNSMEKTRVTFKRDNGLPVSQKKDLDTSSEVNRALLEVKVPHFVRIQVDMKDTRGCLSTITAPGATAEMLIRYREIVIKVAGKVDTGIVDIEMNKLWERVKMHGVNFDRYLGKKTGGGLEKLRQELQAENKGVVLPLAINWIGGPKDVQKKKTE
jgi:hypothetical protein